MKINGTITAKSGSFNQIKKHVSRNWKHDKNEKSVDKTLTQFNIHSNFKSQDKRKIALIKAHYLPYMLRRNAHLKAQGHSERQQSLREYLKNKVPTAIGIATWGTRNDKYDQLMEIDSAYSNRTRKENHTRYYQCASWGLKRYCHGFNQRNKYVKMTNWWTNVDENGAPHVHFELLPLGYTKLDKNGRPTKSHMAPYKSGKKKGQMHRVTGSKPTGDLTKAIEMEMGTKDNRLAFKKWNKREDKAIIRVVGGTFKQRFSKVKNWSNGFNLQHTGRKGSLSMKSFKATWSEIDKRQRKLDNQQKRIQTAQKKLPEYQKINDTLPVLRIEHSHLKQDNDNLNASNNALKSQITQRRKHLTLLQTSVRKLEDHKKRLHKWLHDKWRAFQNKHLNGLYNGIAYGLRAMYPDYYKKFNPDNLYDRYGSRDIYKIVAHDGIIDGKTTYSGLQWFVHGVIHHGNRLVKARTPKQINNSFQNSDDGKQL